ncbi:MAG TPA: MMPL family transporter [Polyangiaceae bacterium]|nr:MMPL family transporter [Polyangiaceae bacterium]
MRARSSLVSTCAIVAVTLVSIALSARIQINGDLASLFPESGDAAALARWNRAFRGRDPCLLLVRGDRADEVGEVVDRLIAALQHAPSIERVIERAPAPETPPDPTLAWAYAGPTARARLAAAVTPEGMTTRLRDTRALLLAPAADDDAKPWLARDPLRLALVPWEARAELAPGVAARAGGDFSADGGRARLVVAQPRGSAFVSADANATMDDIDRAIGESARPGVSVEVAGGHAIARASERMLKRDLAVSGTLSLVLASVAFVATFRRSRALAAVLPPLVVGTVWTTGLAALLPAGLNALTIAFAAVVVGVGVDTGVHVYAALLDARRAGHVGADAARVARSAMWTPTLTAAAVAAVAFASLALSGLRPMQELGVLCGAGELLTTLAILLITPEIGARLEPRALPAPATPPWIEWLDRATCTRRGAAVALACCALPIAALTVVGWPGPADALVALRPAGLAPLSAEEDVRSVFGGQPDQWFVLTADRDEEAARRRADRLSEELERLEQAHDVAGFDALASFAPCAETQRARLTERDALDLPAKREALQAALRREGFDLEACSPAVEAFAHPSRELLPDGKGVRDAASWLFDRHVGHDGEEAIVATYVRPVGDPAADGRARSAIAAVDPSAQVTSFDAIDRALRRALDRDLVVVGGASAALVALAMRLALRSARHALVALATLASEMGMVGLAMRALSVRWHLYDALVLPVLFGVTIDESMFLLHAVRQSSVGAALRSQGPLVAATALTTAAGFVALIACRFPGLRDLGAIGAMGVLAGLVAALVVVPAALRVLGAPLRSR